MTEAVLFDWRGTLVVTPSEGRWVEDALMVGNRSRPDGAAVEAGITTLLLPPLRTVEDRRSHKVLRLVDGG